MRAVDLLSALIHEPSDLQRIQSHGSALSRPATKRPNPQGENLPPAV